MTQQCVTCGTLYDDLEPSCPTCTVIDEAAAASEARAAGGIATGDGEPPEEPSPTTDRSPVSNAASREEAGTPANDAPSAEPESPQAINMHVAVKRFSKDVRKAIERNGFARPSGELVDGASIVLIEVFGRFAVHFSKVIGAPLPAFMATMQMLYEEGMDRSPDAAKPPSLVLLR